MRETSRQANASQNRSKAAALGLWAAGLSAIAGAALSCVDFERDLNTCIQRGRCVDPEVLEDAGVEPGASDAASSTGPDSGMGTPDVGVVADSGVDAGTPADGGGGPDGGDPDGSVMADAGAADAGSSADAGADAGPNPPTDGGLDGGTDAGTSAATDGAVDGGTDAATGGADAATGGTDAATGGTDAATGGTDAATDAGVDPCLTATRLAFSDGGTSVATAAGDTTSAKSSLEGSCGGAKSPEAVYTFTTTAIADLSASVTGTGFSPVVYLRAGSCAGAESGCIAAGADAGASALDVKDLPAGTHFLVVDGQSSASGKFVLSVSLKPPTSGDSCVAPSPPRPLVFSKGSAGGTAVDRGTTVGFKDDKPICGGNRGDVVYTFKTTTDLSLRVSVKSTDNGYHPIIALRTEPCQDTKDIVCGDAKIQGGTANIAVSTLPAGTYFLWVDGFFSSGTYELFADLSPPKPGENCSNAIQLKLDVAGSTDTAKGDTREYIHDIDMGCLAYGPDVVYTFTTKETLGLRASVKATLPTYAPVILLRNEPCVTGTKVKCDEGLVGGTAWLAESTLPAGTYYLWVDGARGSAGAFELTARLFKPNPGETCADPIPLGITGPGTATHKGDTSANFSDFDPDCSGTGQDVVYTFTTSETLSLRASVATTSSMYSPVVSLRKGPCAGGTKVVCDPAPRGGKAAVSVSSLPAGTYFLWVDGYYSAGAFDLEVILSKPVPGDSCDSPLALKLSTAGDTDTVKNDTSGFINDGDVGCLGSGRDVIYVFTIKETLGFRASLKALNPAYKPSLGLRMGQCSAGMRDCKVAQTVGGIASLAVSNLEPGTYYVWADGHDSAGAFELSASLSKPIAGESCENPIKLTTLGTAGSSVAVKGDTTLSFNDRWLCSAPGRDAVYEFTTDQTLSLRVSVTPTGAGTSFLPILYLRTSPCKQGGDVPNTCAYAPQAGGTAAFGVSMLAKGTYYLWVDADSSSGTYDLTATLGQPTLGETCVNSAPLALSKAGDSITQTGDTSGFINDDSPCWAGGPDVVYSFTIPSGTAPLSFFASLEATDTKYLPVLYLRGLPCASGSPLECADPNRGGATASINRATLKPGTYSLWVDGRNAGPFVLKARLATPNDGESCDNPASLGLSSAGDVAKKTGNTSAYINDLGSCNGLDRDLVYTFTTTSTLSFAASLVSKDPAYFPVLQMRKGSLCANSQDVPGTCSDPNVGAGTASLAVSALSAGTYFLWVDGRGSGPFELDARLTTPRPGESCYNPIALSKLTGAGTTENVTGDTTGFFHDRNLGCWGTGPDTVYTFTTTEPLTFQASLVSKGSSYHPSLSLLGLPCLTGSEVTTCGDGLFPQGTASVAKSHLLAGTYYLWVSGKSGAGEGAYELKTSLATPVLGESCTNPKPLTFSAGPAGGTATDTADTSASVDDARTGCGGAGSPDLVYSFTTNKELTLNVTVTPSGTGFQPVLFLREKLCTGFEKRCDAAPAAGSPVNLASTKLPAGTYFLWVDGDKANGASGKFTLSATLQ